MPKDRDPRPEDYRLPSSGRRIERAFSNADSEQPTTFDDGLAISRDASSPQSKPPFLQGQVVYWAGACLICLVIGVILGWGISGEDESSLDRAAKNMERRLEEIQGIIQSQSSRTGEETRRLSALVNDLEKTVVACQRRDGEERQRTAP